MVQSSVFDSRSTCADVDDYGRDLGRSISRPGTSAKGRPLVDDSDTDIDLVRSAILITQHRPALADRDPRTACNGLLGDALNTVQ